MLTFIFKISNLNLHQNLYLLLSSVRLPNSTFKTSHDESQNGQSHCPLFMPFISSRRLTGSPLSCSCSQGKSERRSWELQTYSLLLWLGKSWAQVIQWFIVNTRHCLPAMWLMPSEPVLFFNNRIVMNSDKIFAMIKAF